MKKKIYLAMLTILGGIVLPLTACNGLDFTTSESIQESQSSSSQPVPKPEVPPIVNDSDLPTEIVPLNEPAIQIHYQRIAGTYKEWGLWLWAEGKDGLEYKFNYQDDYGVIAYYPLSNFGNPKSLGFIVKKLFEFSNGGWEKDGNYDRFMDIDMLQKDENDTYHVYIRSKNKNVYTDEERKSIMNAVTACQFENGKDILIQVNNKIKDPILLKNGEPVEGLTITGSILEKHIKLTEDADVGDSYVVAIEFADGSKVNKNVSVRKLYDTSFDYKYYYGGELGAIYSNSSTTFRVWSPISTDIVLRIYNNGTPKAVSEELGDDTFIEYQMERNKEKGIFEYTVPGDLGGKYYTYVVTNGYNPFGKEIVDPYAKGVGVNGLRGMVVDFSKTNPEGWENVTYSTTDKKHLTVYETHVADLTSSETWNGKAENKKKYLGMIEEGTTYTRDGVTVKTGFDHIKELGVNAIQVLPFFDSSNDEVDCEFNWGYNPLNYNAVDGSYSSNPYDGYVRINEIKQVIKAYKEAGISFIMDVVYNHVNGLAGSNFDVLMPFYYFRYSETGGASSGSGCGNDTASEKLMFRKFMKDSTAFWTKEYKLDGFRFDLMGLHDVDTMNQVVADLKAINPNITVYGEAWLMGTDLSIKTTLANQNAANSFVDFGQFNDKGRDALMAGGLSPAYSKGWMNSTLNPVQYTKIVEMLKGITSGVTTDPNKSVNYVACHDNYTLHDRNIAADIYDEEAIKKSNVLANSLVMTSQGISFMLSGDELLRSKIVYDEDGNPVVNKEAKPENEGQIIYEVSHNSYSSGYKTNEINWDLKVTHLDMFRHYQKLIALKQNVADLGLNEEEIKNSKTYSADSLRNGTVITSTFSDDKFNYTAYYGAACLYNYEKDSNDPFVIDLTGKEIYLSTQHSDVKESSITLDPYETIIVMEKR